MKNLLLALMGITMLSTANAQAPASEWLFELDTDCNGTTQVYEAVVVNAGSVNINAQLIAPDGSTKNFHANIQQETATLEGQDVCGCVTTPDTGLPSGNVTHCIGETNTNTLACEGSALNVNGTIVPITQVVEQDNDNVIVLVTDTGVEYLFFRENSCLYLFDFACLDETTNTFVFINGQGTVTISEELWSCLDLPCVCPEDLSDELAATEAQLDACQSVNAGLSDAVSAQGAQINDLTSSVDSLQALLDQANAVIANLATENEDLATDLYECQSNLDDCSTDLAVLQGQADNCAQMYQDYQLFYVQETNALNAEIGDLEDELDGCENANEGLNLQIVDLYDVLNFADSAANATIDSLQAELDAGCEYEQFVIDELLQANLELQADLVECDSVAIAEVDYWMDNYYDAVAEGNALVDSLNTELEAAQACCSSCPAAIETAVDNALEQAEEDCNYAQMQVAAAQYELGYNDAVEECEENNAGELLTVFQNGYNAGLEECEEVSGLVDIDGTTVIPVTGYYNQLGQVIDPARTTGIIIRKHADGTFSKYYR